MHSRVLGGVGGYVSYWIEWMGFSRWLGGCSRLWRCAEVCGVAAFSTHFQYYIMVICANSLPPWQLETVSDNPISVSPASLFDLRADIFTLVKLTLKSTLETFVITHSYTFNMALSLIDICSKFFFLGILTSIIALVSVFIVIKISIDHF